MSLITEVVQRDGWHAVLVGDDLRQVIFLDEPELRQLQAQTAPRDPGLFLGPLELLLREEILLYE
jgi:hypothetical protein